MELRRPLAGERDSEGRDGASREPLTESKQALLSWEASEAVRSLAECLVVGWAKSSAMACTGKVACGRA